MPEGAETIITGVVEGVLDEALLRRIINYTGLSLGKVYGRKGKQSLLQYINGYNNAARFAPWVALIDLDRDCDCAPPCVQRWLPNPSPHMCFRVAVRAAEAWLLADRDQMARCLGIGVAQMPNNPDDLEDPKRALINLARRSRRRTIYNDIVPREGSGRVVGPLYTTRMIEFIQDEIGGWRPSRALRVSGSLARCIARLRRFGANVP